MSDRIISYPATDGLRSVLAERARQDAKWGIQNHHPRDYFLILTEEVGELAQAIADGLVFATPTEEAVEHVREEAVHVAAVALAMVEAIDRGTWIQDTEEYRKEAR